MRHQITSFLLYYHLNLYISKKTGLLWAWGEKKYLGKEKYIKNLPKRRTRTGIISFFLTLPSEG